MSKEPYLTMRSLMNLSDDPSREELLLLVGRLCSVLDHVMCVSRINENPRYRKQKEYVELLIHKSRKIAGIIPAD